MTVDEPGAAEWQMDDHGRTGGPVGWECSNAVLDARGDDAVTVLPSVEPYAWLDDLSIKAVLD